MRIITGRAGSGKTEMLMREIAAQVDANAGRQILIVPELFSHAYERRLAQATQNRGARTAEVLTFSRLAGRVFAEVGGLADTALSAAGQLLTLQEAVRRTAAGLKVYAGATSNAQTLRELLRAVDELKCYAVPPEQLLAVLPDVRAQEESALADKLYDLGQIATMYDRLCEQSLPDPRQVLTLLADRLPQSRCLKGATIYIDAFQGLTPQEVHITAQFLDQGLPITAAITCDMHYPDLFVSGCNMVKTLSRLAQRKAIAVTQIDLGESKCARAADLVAIEQRGLLPVQSTQLTDGESTQIYAAATPFEECEYAAAYICRKVREQGARYRDFVIAASDMQPYTAALTLAMARYDVPVFLSEKAQLLDKPPLALVTGALQAVTEGFRYEDVFGCLRTGLCALTAEEIDQLEEYVLLWRIRAGAWQRPFAGHPQGYGQIFDETAQETLDALNALRERAIAPFVALAEALKSAQTATDFAKALYAFLEQTEVPVRMQQRAQLHEQAGRVQLAEEYRQLWEILVTALEQFSWTCGDAPMDARRFAQLLPLVLGEYDVGTIPVSLDQVTCGSMDRVCEGNAKHMILLGANDGLLPKTQAGGGVLTQADRTALEQFGVSLSAFGAERMLMQQEILYRALACPTQTLLLCYHQTDETGKAARPSYLIGTLRQMLEGIRTESTATQAGRFRLEAERPSVELACAYCSGTKNAATYAAYAHYQHDPRVVRAANWNVNRGPLEDKQTAHALYGKQVRVTASRVDTFYSCRFAFFMQYGLKANARRVADFAAPEAGTFLHYVLENTLQALHKEAGGAAQASATQAQKHMKKYVAQYVKEQLGGLENKPARFRYLFRRLVKTMEHILENVLEELRVSDFAPIDYELQFSQGGDLPPVSVQDDEVTTRLSGKVDRVDGYIRNGRLYVRVMDYKSGKKSFSLSDIWYGLNMQLVLYLSALQEQGLMRYRDKLSQALCEIVPAGVLYIPAREQLLDAPRDVDEDTLRALREKALRRSGLVTDDMDILEAMEHGLQGDGRFIPVKIRAPKKGEEGDVSVVGGIADLARFGKLARYAQRKLLEMGNALVQGDVRCNPYQNGQASACQWCSYAPACQFDQTAGERMRALTKLQEQEFWQRVEGAEAYGDNMDR